MTILETMVEVFKTDVYEPGEAIMLAALLRQRFPGCTPSFDLEDCDRVLRVAGEQLCTNTIITIVNQHGYNCHILD